MISEIERLIKEEMIKGIKDVMDNTLDSVKLPRVRPGDVLGYLTNELKLSVKGQDMDTNGYTWDYWLTLNIDDVTYTLSGDGWYDETATFSKG